MKRQAVKNPLYVRLCLGVALAAMLTGCAKPPQPPASPTAESLPAALPSPPPEPAPSTALPAPTVAEVRAAVGRIYKDAVRMSPAPGFVVGDFNGDQSEDLAVVVEPVKEQLDALNSDVAAWLIGDPLTASLPAPALAVARDEPKTRPVISERDAALLVVIHGYGAQGWRDPEAQQSYLLKNSTGSGLAAQTRRAALAAIKNTPVPPARGDVIKTTTNDRLGFLYYTGSSYAWYDPRTYRGEAATRMAH